MSDLDSERVAEENDQLAEELDAFLTAWPAGQELPRPGSLPPAQRGMAEALLRLAETLRPEPSFAAQLEAKLRAQGAPSAATPARAAVKARRRFRLPLPSTAWYSWPARAAVLALVVLAMLIAVPSVRAGVMAFLRIGTIRIAVDEPTARPLPAGAATAGATTAIPTATPLDSVLDLAGATTLEDARRRANFPIRLPLYPPDLGPPDRVFFQDLGGPAVVLVWMDAAQPGRVRLSLHLLSSTTFAQKGEPPVIEETRVNGQAALWTEGPYMLEYLRGQQVPYGARRLVTGHVLLWAEQSVTYRLETDLPLEEAVHIAESLR